MEMEDAREEDVAGQDGWGMAPSRMPSAQPKERKREVMERWRSSSLEKENGSKWEGMRKPGMQSGGTRFANVLAPERREDMGENGPVMLDICREGAN